MTRRQFRHAPARRSGPSVRNADLESRGRRRDVGIAKRAGVVADCVMVPTGVRRVVPAEIRRAVAAEARRYVVRSNVSLRARRRFLASVPGVAGPRSAPTVNPTSASSIPLSPRSWTDSPDTRSLRHSTSHRRGTSHARSNPPSAVPPGRPPSCRRNEGVGGSATRRERPARQLVSFPVARSRTSRPS